MSYYEQEDIFDFVYDFLIFENLDEQDVLDIMACVPIDEILEVIELDEDEAWRNRNFKDFRDRSIENVAKRGGKLSQEIKDIEKRPFSRFRPGLRKQKKKKQKQLQSLKQAFSSKSGQLQARVAVSDAMHSNTKNKIKELKNRLDTLKDPHNIVPGPRNIRRSANTIKRFQREEFILEYLLDYGYADTYENAIEIYESTDDELRRDAKFGKTVTVAPDTSNRAAFRRNSKREKPVPKFVMRRFMKPQGDATRRTKEGRQAIERGRELTKRYRLNRRSTRARLGVENPKRGKA